MKNNLLSPFFEIAIQSPGSIAATDSIGEVTYGQLLENALRCYHTFSNLELSYKKIAIFLPNGIEALSTLVSALTAGLCYTVLDPASPTERNRVICSTGDFDYLITNEELLSEAEKFFNNERIFVYHELLKPEPVELSVITDVEPTDNAILFFTSGSTGTPKGIIHRHDRISVGLKASTLIPGDHYDMIIPMAFVASYNLFHVLIRGLRFVFSILKRTGLQSMLLL